MLTYGVQTRVQSEVLGQAREVLVSVPVTYENDTETRYPVVFVLGGASEFLHSVATVRYLSNDTMPDAIIVGVVHVSRGDELRPDFPNEGRKNEHEQRFRRFLTAELVPYIDETYRTHPYRILVGYSLGANVLLKMMGEAVTPSGVKAAMNPSEICSCVQERIFSFDRPTSVRPMYTVPSRPIAADASDQRSVGFFHKVLPRLSTA